MTAWSGAGQPAIPWPTRSAARRVLPVLAALLAMVLLVLLVLVRSSRREGFVRPPSQRGSADQALIPPADDPGARDEGSDGSGDEPGRDGPGVPHPPDKDPPQVEPPKREPPTRPPDRPPAGQPPWSGDSNGADPGPNSSTGSMDPFMTDGSGGSTVVPVAGGGSQPIGSGEGGEPSSGTTTTGGPVGGDDDDGAAVDCNGDGVNDALQVAQCILADVDLNGVPDCCDEGVPCRTNALTNGGFESGPVAICGSTCVTAPATVADAWTNTGGTLAIGRSDSGCAGRTFEPPHGARCIQVGSACGTVGRLSQSVELTSGSTLRLRFRSSCADGSQPVFVQTGIGGEVFLDRIDCPSDDGPWAVVEHVVVATAGSAVVSVSVEGAASASGAWIDDLFLEVDRVACAPDLDSDGVVADPDLDLLFGAWSSDGSACACDLDASGVVDGADLGILMAGWGACG